MHADLSLWMRAGWPNQPLIADVLTVEDNVVPLDRAHMSEQRQIDTVTVRVGSLDDLGHLNVE